MSVKTSILQKIAILSACAVSILLFILLITLSLLNRPIADDVSYFRYFEGGSVGNFLYWHYFEHTGRLLQSLLVAFGYVIGGGLSVKFMPVLVYLLLIVVSTWASYQFIPWRGKYRLSMSIITGLSVASVSIILMPSIYDSYLWWTSSSIYLMSIVMLIFYACVFHLFIKKNTSKLSQAALLLVIVIGQTLSEITSAIAISLAVVLLAYYLFKKMRHHVRNIAKILVALVIGFCLTYFSPGSIARRNSEDGGAIGFDFMRIFILSTRHMFELIGSLSLWEVSLLLVIGIFIGVSIKKISRKNIKLIIPAVLIFSFISIYGSFCINNYVWYNMPLRALTLPSFTLTLSIILLSAVLTNYLLSRYQKKIYIRVFAIFTLILLGISLLGIYKLAGYSIPFMIERNEAYLTRENNIAMQLTSNPPTIKIEALPIILNSQATDLIYGQGEQIPWYENALKGHNNIPIDTKIEVVAPPNNYCLFGIDLQGGCENRGDNTTSRKVLHKVDAFFVYYFSLNY